jgi:hypothetical protein
MKKSELRAMIREVLHEELATAKDSLAEARKVNPTPPATLDIIKIEPNIQDAYGSSKWRHYDEITYMDPYLNVERKASVWEEQPGFGKYFGWGADHSRHWNYAAYDYNGKLLPDIDPNGHLSKGIKDAISGIVADINDPSDSDEE